MMEFLEFVNTADGDTLNKLTSITPTQVERILAAQPFATLEDLAKVKGLNRKRLASLQEEYLLTVDAEKPVEIEAVKEAEQPEPVVETENEIEKEPKPSRRNYAGRIIGRIVVILLLAGAVYAVIKWGIPFINETFIKPAESNATSITDLASQQSAEVTRLNEEITALQARLAALEGRADAFDLSLQAHEETLTRLQNMQERLDSQLAAQKSDLLEELSTQIALTRGVDLLSRSRLYLSESNYGLAKIDLQTSRNLLYSLLDVVPADQTNGLKMVINRVDMALANLPAYPVVAVYDVDTAWQLLIDGLPNIPTQVVTPVVLPPTETPTLVVPLEPTLEATPEVTPTP